MPHPLSVAVFCGSKTGHNPAWAAAAGALGAGLARAGIRLVYGGGQIGLMGVVADATLAAGGQVLGVIPRFLTRFEVAHPKVVDLVITENMHSRKHLMFDQSDAFVVLPGGIGTFDETMEVITWRQLKLHDKPILIANIEGSADALLGMIDGAIADGFMAPDNRSLFEVVDDVGALLARLADVKACEDGQTDRL